MKKWILILFMIFTLKLSAQNSTPRFVKLTLTEIKSLEKEFDWNNEEILIINFITPIKVSDSDNEMNIIKTIEHWNDFYKNLDFKKVKNGFVYSDCLSKNQKVENKNIHIDKNQIIRNIFFPRDKLCSGIAILNKNGDFKVQNGKYTEEEINNFISELKN